MATESIHVSALIPATPEAVYEAWLSSELHTRMTGASARIEPHVGGSHTAWDDYISGTTLELDPGRRIVQTWRSTQFPEESGHSQIAVTFEAEGGHTRLHIAHTDIPQGQGAGYQSGWHDHYFGPMIAYFSGTAAPAPAEEAVPPPAAQQAEAREPAAKRAARKPAAKKAPKKVTAKKATAKKATAKKAARKPAAKKAATKKPTAKRAAKKPAAGKPAAKKAAKKAASKK